MSHDVYCPWGYECGNECYMLHQDPYDDPCIPSEYRNVFISCNFYYLQKSAMKVNKLTMKCQDDVVFNKTAVWSCFYQIGC